MGAVLLREEWDRQPQYQARINRTNPLTSTLLWTFGSLTAPRDNTGRLSFSYHESSTIVPTVHGLGRKFFNAGYTDGLGTAVANCPTPVDGSSLFIIARVDALSNYGRLLGLGGGSVDITSVGQARFQNGSEALSSNTVAAGEFFTLFVYGSVGAGYTIELNGVTGGTTAAAFSGMGSLQSIAEYGGWGVKACTVVTATCWNSILTAEQRRKVSDSPWLLFEKENLTVPFAASSGAADLAGAAVVNPAASAAIALSVPMVAAGIVVATTGGAMQLALPMSGNATGQASTAGGVSLSVPLAVSALIQALATAGLSQSDPLVGGAAGVASSTGNMTLNVSMAGAELIQALAAANLTVTGDGMSGSAIVQPSAAGNMSLGLPLATSSLVVSNTSGTLTQIVPMVTSAASASLVTGGLDLAVTLNTAALIEALAVVSLSTDKNMGGGGAANASTMGNLTLRVNMSTAAIIQAVAAGGLAGNGQLIGTPGYRVTRAPRSWKVTRKPRSWRVSE